MKQLNLYYDFIRNDGDYGVRYHMSNIKPNCQSNAKGRVFGNFGFLITKQAGMENYFQFENDFKLRLTNSRKEKYIYLLEPQSLHNLLDDLPSIIPKENFDDIKKGKAVLCICYIHEGDNEDTFVNNVDKFLSDNSISSNNFLFINNNPKIPKHKNLMSIDYYYNHVSTMYQEDYRTRYEGKKRIQSIDSISFNEKRKYRFLCFNRAPKLHRTILGAFLLRDGYLPRYYNMTRDIKAPSDLKNIGNYSLGSFEDIHTETGDIWDTSYRNRKMPIYDERLINELKPHWNDLMSITPLTIDMTGEEMIDGYNSSWRNIDPGLYQDHYFSIVTSTSFDTEWFHPDEKFWKPLGQAHPFIWVGPANSLQHLHENGFKSFSPFIDESYDTEQDCQKRMLMIVDEIRRLCEMSDDEIADWFKGMKDILTYNWRRILSHNPNPFDEMYNKLYYLQSL